MYGVQIIGDKPLRHEGDLEEASTKKTHNTVLLTLRKCGTVSHLIRLVQKAQALGMGVVLAVDTSEAQSDVYELFVAHAVVGLRVGQIALGPLRHAEVMGKVHELARIERVGNVPYAASAFRNFHS
jgi:enolase